MRARVTLDLLWRQAKKRGIRTEKGVGVHTEKGVAHTEKGVAHTENGAGAHIQDIDITDTTIICMFSRNRSIALVQELKRILRFH